MKIWSEKSKQTQFCGQTCVVLNKKNEISVGPHDSGSLYNNQALTIRLSTELYPHITYPITLLAILYLSPCTDHKIHHLKISSSIQNFESQNSSLAANCIKIDTLTNASHVNYQSFSLYCMVFERSCSLIGG